MVTVGYEHFDRMTLHRCSDSSPIFFEFFLIDGFSSREYNVCRYDRSSSKQHKRFASEVAGTILEFDVEVRPHSLDGSFNSAGDIGGSCSGKQESPSQRIICKTASVDSCENLLISQAFLLLIFNFNDGVV